MVEEQNEERRKQEVLDEENAQEEQKRLQEKIDMEIASKYIQKKWNWYQTEGKLLAKKRKKGGKKGKGKKKK